MNVKGVEDKYGIQFCDRQSIVIEKGKGSFVWDEEGARYLDFTSGWGVTCLGHAHPVVIDALYNQAKKLTQNPNSGFTYSPVRARLLEYLCKQLPANLNRMFFVNSGAEANDAALKLARKVSGKTRVISTKDSFHGRTFNTLSVSGGACNARRYIPTMPDTHFVNFGNVDELEQAINYDTAAVIVEPIQGEGGVRIPSPQYLEFVSQICKKYSAFLIIDEIQTGFGRTGKLFAIEHSSGQLEPDILTMGKGIAGGFPFAGFAVSEAIASKLEKGDHGGTYCGNPLGCAVALAVIRFMSENRIANQALTSGKYLLRGLNSLADQFPRLVREARGIGLLTALEFLSDDLVQKFSLACQRQGLLVTPTRNGIVRLIPDLLVETTSINEALAIMENALDDLDSQLAATS